MTKRHGNFEYVRSFLQDLVDNLTASSDSSLFSRGKSWFRAGEGQLTLEPKETKSYQDVLSRLVRQLAPNADLSESAIGSVLLDAIFEVVDIPKRRNPDPTVRVNAAIKKLEALAKRKAAKYDCWIEVGGLDEKSLPSSFGRVRFVAVNQYQLRTLRRTTARGHSSQASSLRRSFDRILGHSFGVVTTTARDTRAALNLAKREVRASVECLNFFSDLVPYNDAWVFLPGEHESTDTTAFAVDQVGAVFMTMAKAGPMGTYSFAKLRARGPFQGTIRRVRALLQKQSRNAVEELLLTAVRWSGRATISERREEAFLLYAIALGQ